MRAVQRGFKSQSARNGSAFQVLCEQVQIKQRLSNGKPKGFGSPRSSHVQLGKALSEERHKVAQRVVTTDKRGVESARLPFQQLKDNTASPTSRFGPRGLLLVGFSKEDAAAVQQWFATIEPGFRVSCCSEDLLGKGLEGAITGADGSFLYEPSWHQPKELVPRTAIFSGMSQDEMLGIVQFWNTSGIQEPIFASVVAAAKDKQLQAVLLEVAQAYAGSKAPPEEKLDSDPLRQLLKARMAAKGRSGNSSSSRPIVIQPTGNSH